MWAKAPMGLFLLWEEMGKDCKDQPAHMALSRDAHRMTQPLRANARAQGLKHDNLSRLYRYEAKACKFASDTLVPEPDRLPPP